VLEPEAVDDEAAGCCVGVGVDVGSSAATLGADSGMDSLGVAGMIDWAGFAAALYDRTISFSRCLSSTLYLTTVDFKISILGGGRY